MEYSKRQNNVELCRICIMFFIVVHHCIVSGLGLNEILNSINPTFSAYNAFLMILNSFVIIPVNVFFLISGYFSIKFNKKKIVSLLYEILFYSILVYMGLIIIGKAEITVKSLFKYSVFSISLYWFAIVYVALVITSPALNCIWEYIIEPHEKEIMLGLFLSFCILCFISPDSLGFYLGINNGYSYIFSVYLYFVGKTIKKHENSIRKNMGMVKSLSGYAIMAFLTSGVGITLLLFKKGNLAWKLYSYNAPFVFIESVFFFLFFLNIKGNNQIQKYIGKFGINVFGVYLLHSMPLLKTYRFYIVNRIVQPNNLGLDFVAILGYCFLLYIVCLAISRIRYTLARCIFKYKDHG